MANGFINFYPEETLVAETLPERLATDIDGVRRIGLEEWQRTFFWPVSEQAFSALLDDVLDAFDHLYEALDTTSRDLVLTDTGFLTLLVQHLHALAVAAFCQRHGIALMTGSLSKAFYEPDWAALGKVYLPAIEGGAPWRLRLCQLVKDMKFNAHLPLGLWLRRLFRPSDYWSLGSQSPLKEEYIATRNCFCTHHYWETLLAGARRASPAGCSEALTAEIGGCLQEIQARIGTRFSVDIDPEPIRRCWLERLSALAILHHHIAAAGRLPKTLFVTEVAKPMHKIIAIAMKGRGVEVIGFHHGHETVNIWRKTVGYSQYGQCTRFVSPSKKIAEFQAREYTLAGISGLNPVSFCSAESTQYAALTETCRRTPGPKSIHTVMLMGYPLNAMRYLVPGGVFYAFQLDVQQRVARLLRQHGFHVIYKTHPERRREAEGVFESVSDRTIMDPFEAIWEEADAYLFTYIGTTTFGFALCTNRPIFVLDIEGTPWNEDLRALLERRCHMVPARFDERNRISFNEDRLIDGLSRRVNGVDHSFVEAFLYPDRGGRS